MSYHQPYPKDTTRTLELFSFDPIINLQPLSINRESKIHPATRTFQAIRIYVNDELDELHSGLDCAHKFLKPGAPCVAISFHSLEDRLIKRHFHSIALDKEKNLSVRQQILSAGKISHSKKDIDNSLKKRWRPLSRKIVSPSIKEVVVNPRSRSAKLRAATKEHN